MAVTVDLSKTQSDLTQIKHTLLPLAQWKRCLSLSTHLSSSGRLFDNLSIHTQHYLLIMVHLFIEDFVLNTSTLLKVFRLTQMFD